MSSSATQPTMDDSVATTTSHEPCGSRSTNEDFGKKHNSGPTLPSAVLSGSCHVDDDDENNAHRRGLDIAINNHRGSTTRNITCLSQSIWNIILSFTLNVFKHSTKLTNSSGEEQNLCSSEEQHYKSPEECYHRSIFDIEVVPLVSQSPLAKFYETRTDSVNETEQESIKFYCDFFTTWIRISHINKRMRELMRTCVVTELIEFDFINFMYFYMLNEETLVFDHQPSGIELDNCDNEALVFRKEEYKHSVHALFIEFMQSMMDPVFVKRISLDVNYVFDWIPIHESEIEKTLTSSRLPEENIFCLYNTAFPNIEVLTLNFTYRGRDGIYDEEEQSSTHLKSIDTSIIQNLSKWKSLKELRLCWHVEVNEDTRKIDLECGSHLVQEFLKIINEAKSNPNIEYVSVYINGSAFHVTKTEEGTMICNHSFPSVVFEQIGDIVDDNSHLKLLYLCIDHFGNANYNKQLSHMSFLQNILHIEIEEINIVNINQLFNLQYPKLVTLILTNIITSGVTGYEVAISSQFPKLEELVLKSNVESSNVFNVVNVDTVYMRAPLIKKLSLIGIHNFSVSKNSFGPHLEMLEILTTCSDMIHNYSRWITSLKGLKNLIFKIEPERGKSFQEYPSNENLEQSLSTIINHDGIVDILLKDTRYAGITLKCPQAKKVVIRIPHLQDCFIECAQLKSIDLNGLIIGCNSRNNKKLFYYSHQWRWETPLVTSLNFSNPQTSSGMILPNALISHIEELEIRLVITAYEKEKELLPALFMRIDELCGKKSTNKTLKNVKIQLEISTFYLTNPLVKSMSALLEWNEHSKTPYESEQMKMTIQHLLKTAKTTETFTDDTLLVQSPNVVSLEMNIHESVQKTKINCPNLKHVELVQTSTPGRLKFCDTNDVNQLESFMTMGLCSPFNHLHTHHFASLKTIEIIDPQQRFSFVLSQLPSLEVLDVRTEYGFCYNGEERSYVTLKDYQHHNLKMLRLFGVRNVTIELDLQAPNLRILDVRDTDGRKCEITFSNCPKLMKKTLRYSLTKEHRKR
ncbi:hypothetical protein C9374_012669 [Naegleria lovaniensis]|uniref:Uncharacterized protein n=1 Tax=Naegleria lovaniensis TaxID=51637 RepID=A0AA88H3H7_NAELO|nr:uncharacterized protein C9374_012669 [Naegleria lovaniensis]KAG2392417.1 hypothetical protein C9374_012669 [Naegleria lovaniensis]